MKRQNRLTSSRQFRRALAEGKRGSADGVVCFVVRAEGESPPRVGVTTTRKFAGAVERNRAKRLLREAARRVLPQLAPGTELVLLATPAINGRKFQDVMEQTRIAAKRAGLEG